MTAKNKISKATNTAINNEVAEQELPVVKYYEGSPLQYRADCKNGKFNINGNKEVGKEMSIRPVAWRFFTDDILGMGKKNWVELFFVDPNHCLSAVLFHGFSRENLENIASTLYYSNVTLGDINLHIAFDKKQNKEVKSTYYIATFDFDVVEPEELAPMKEAVKDFNIFRQETLNEDCDFQMMFNFFNPYHLDINLEIEIESEDSTKTLKQ